MSGESEHSNGRVTSALRTLPFPFSILVISIALFALAGWAFDVPWMEKHQSKLGHDEG